MYLQIAVSPPNQVTKKAQPIIPLEDVAVLKLAPFSPNPKIFFENVAVGEVDVKKLIIQNPNAVRNKLTITKLPPADRYVSLSWNEAEIEAREEIVLELTWAPKEEGSWREVVTVRDGKNVDRNVAIIFKSVQGKGKKRVTKPSIKLKPTVVAVSAVKKFRSPKNTKKKRSPFKVSEPVLESMCMPKSYKCENCENNIHITTCSPLKKKNKNIRESNKENSPAALFQQKLENFSPIYQQKVDNVSFSKLSLSEKINRMNNSSDFSSPTNINFKCENILQTPLRRETYIKHSPDDLDDSLEFEQKLDKIESPEVRNNLKPQCAESYMKKLNLDMSPEISVLNNTKNKSGDNYLLQKLLSDSDSFAFSTVTKKTSHYQFTLNDTGVVNDYFHPNNCSTETKIPEKITRNNSSTPKELFKGNNTFDISPARKNSPNLSGDTYSIKSNLSSASTYDLSPDYNIHKRIREAIDKEPTKISTSSPLLQPQTNQFHAASNYLNFSGINVKNALFCITEEEQPSDISIKNVSTSSNYSNPGTKRKLDPPELVFTLSPPKRAFIKPKSPKSNKNVGSTWSKKLEKTEKIRRRSVSTLKLNLSKISSKSNTSNISNSSVNITQSSCSIDPFLIAAMYDSNTSVNPNLDPFISSTLYYDETWLDKQTQELKKWLNALLTPPSELVAAAEVKKVDVAKLWQDCGKRDLIYAPTKEKVSSKYHTNHKLEILRKSAKNIFNSLEMRNVFSKVAIIITNKQLCMREDKNLHLDVGLQSHVLTLLLCYNPLWLRIGLETIYNEPIPLESNSDVIGLSTFIMLRFFNCPDLMPKNKQKVSHIKYLPTYSARVKSFTLKMFLMLVYFLDQAKNKKLISHDPCLFCRDAPIKESKELLLSFSRELLSAVGDITRFLRRLGYEVSHKQCYIDEFDYAVKNLGVDLRDGIRLTKVMETILLRNDLTTQLRGPAISRLQKIHNVKLALDSLNSAGYTIAGEITAKDIVDGHREKTLSLLWQIIYKFQAPRFSAAATKIQIWWKSLSLVIKRRILDRPRKLRNNSAIKIQQYYRSWKLMKRERTQFLIIKKSAITIQRFVRSMFLLKRDRLQYLIKRQAIIITQQRYRAQKLMKIERNNYLELKNAAIFVQQNYRAKLAIKQSKEQYLKLKETVVKLQRIFRSKRITKQVRQNFLEQRTAAVTIQQQFRATLLMRKEKNAYVQTRNTIIKLQQRFRATILMRQIKQNYVEQKRSAVLIQQKYRAITLMKQTRKSFLEKKQAAITIQQTLRANLAMKQARKTYLEQRKAALIIQNKFRSYLAMKNSRQSYLKLKQATVMIQQQFRANRAMKIARAEYLEQRKSAISIQRKFRAHLEMKKCRENYSTMRRAVITIQQRFRANVAMKKDRQNYLLQRNSALIIQTIFRSYIQMKICREYYIKLRQSTVYIQRQFRANLAIKMARNQYLEKLRAINFLQQKVRARLAMNKCRKEYLTLRNTTVYVQQTFRANVEMKLRRESYLKLKHSTTLIQQRFRATMLMKVARHEFIQKRNAAVYIQRKFRAYSEVKSCRKNYLELREAVLNVQERFRANKAMKQARNKYLEQRNSAVIIQCYYRSYQQTKHCKESYLALKQATLVIQHRYRALRAMKSAREEYLSLRKAAVCIQNRFRANLAMKSTRHSYLEQRNSAIKIQKYFRSFVHMKQCKENYLRLKGATLVIQQRFRANGAMKNARNDYLKLKQAALIVQTRFRANLAMKNDRANYLHQRKTAIFIQRNYRQYRIAKKCLEEYLKLKQVTLVIQQRFRANRAMKQVRENYLEQRNSALLIQQKYRAYVQMKNCRNNYLSIRRSAIFVQNKFRAYLQMKKCRHNYLELRKATIYVQNKFRAYLQMKECRHNYLELRKATIYVQNKFRANRVRKQVKEEYIQQLKSVRIIQNKFRAYKEMVHCRLSYLILKKSTCIIQQRFREYLLMKEQRTTYLQIKKSTIVLQKYFRSYLLMKQCRQEFLRKKEAAIKIQRYFRAYRQKCMILKQKITIKAVITIQCWVRMYLAKKKLEVLRENSKDTEEMREKRRLNNAVTKIIALWRGYKTRKVMSKKMTLIHQRSVSATNNAAPELSVGKKNREAIDILMYQTSMREIIRALTILDFTTRLFPNLCVEVCDEITERLYILLCFTNRSVPDMDASILCVSVLINLYKFPPTSSAVWKTQYLERLLSLLLHWSDKDGLLFPYVCTLIWLFTHKQEYCEVIKGEENVDKILKKTYQQCERRQKMLGKMRNAPVTIPAKGQKDVLPILKPDWGIINDNKPRVFKNPVFAIKCLLRKLNL